MLSRGIKIPYVPEKQSAAAEIERQLRRLVVFYWRKHLDGRRALKIDR
jgi:hypothetical protein